MNMKRLSMSALLVSLGGYWVSVVHAQPAEMSVWQGIYTSIQADTGKVLFTQHCASCHTDSEGASAGHDAAPAIVGEGFRERWVDASIADIFDTIRQTMPVAAPNSLSPQQYADLTAFILKLNQYPAGESALQADAYDAMLDTFIDPAPE